ncbi:MAG: hypothetical protein HYS07_01105 [Chlamydiae bacterium]|nr:hypothetical protein [Chlamydiota bacterium]MBI3276518.1 hypothetical protein [Chlamydiota bacterium]
MKYNDLRSLMRTPLFSIHDIELSTKKLFDYQLSLWVKKGYLIKLKNGSYAFSQDRDRIKGEWISFFLYQPSYISLEKALFHYGFIPEMVYAFTAVTTKTNRIFQNPLGHFIYRHIRPSLFWGYQPIVQEDFQYLIAEPEKAVLDYLYLNLNRIKTQQDFDHLRWNYEGLREILNPKKFQQYTRAFNLKKMERYAKKCLP